VDRALGERGYLRGDDFSRLFTAAIRGVYQERSRGHCSFGHGVWRGSRLPGFSDDDFDRDLWPPVRTAGALAGKRSARNDCTRVAGFAEWARCITQAALIPDKSTKRRICDSLGGDVARRVFALRDTPRLPEEKMLAARKKTLSAAAPILRMQPLSAAALR